MIYYIFSVCSFYLNYGLKNVFIESNFKTIIRYFVILFANNARKAQVSKMKILFLHKHFVFMKIIFYVPQVGKFYLKTSCARLKGTKVYLLENALGVQRGQPDARWRHLALSRAALRTAQIQRLLASAAGLVRLSEALRLLHVPGDVRQVPVGRQQSRGVEGQVGCGGCRRVAGERRHRREGGHRGHAVYRRHGAAAAARLRRLLVAVVVVVERGGGRGGESRGCFAVAVAVRGVRVRVSGTLKKM